MPTPITATQLADARDFLTRQYPVLPRSRTVRVALPPPPLDWSRLTDDGPSDSTVDIRAVDFEYDHRTQRWEPIDVVITDDEPPPADETPPATITADGLRRAIEILRNNNWPHLLEAVDWYAAAQGVVPPGRYTRPTTLSPNDLPSLVEYLRRGNTPFHMTRAEFTRLCDNTPDYRQGVFWLPEEFVAECHYRGSFGDEVISFYQREPGRYFDWASGSWRTHYVNPNVKADLHSRLYGGLPLGAWDRRLDELHEMPLFAWGCSPTFQFSTYSPPTPPQTRPGDPCTDKAKARRAMRVATISSSGTTSSAPASTPTPPR